jgi:hypothetical protein
VFKYIPKILWAIVATLSLVLAGVFGTSPASAKDGLIVSDCDEFGRIGWTVYWSNDTAKELAFVFDTGIPGEPQTTDTVSANTEGAIDFGRGLDSPKDGQTYTLTITLDTVVVYQADWVNDCPWQGMVVTVDKFTAATDPSPSPTLTPTETTTPTPPVEPPVTPTPPAEPTVTPTPTAQTAAKPAAKLKKGKSAKLAKKTKQGVRLSWKTTTKKVCKVKKYKVKALKKGTCKLKATAPAGPGLAAYKKKFRIKVK